MIEILMVSDLWGHSVHFYSFGWKSGYEPYMAQELIFFAYLFMYLSYFCLQEMCSFTSCCL